VKGPKTCTECGARETKGSILHRPDCGKRARREIIESPAVQLGRRGGQARARNLSKEALSEIARKGAQTRWDKVREAKEEVG
jgi:hypothetical protein